jgi:hypothetical protein
VTPFGPQCRFPGLGIGFIGSIPSTAAVTCDFSAHCRRARIAGQGDLQGLVIRAVNFPVGKIWRASFGTCDSSAIIIEG